MEMHITPDWLRNKIETTSETEIEAGVSVTYLNNLDMFLPRELFAVADEQRILYLKHAFGLLIRNLRLMNKLTVSTLADAASIDKDELCLIESDPHYITKPRTVFQLAKYFGMKVEKMMKIAGASQTLDQELEDKALKFAAKSDGVSSLNEQEQQVLNEYVKFLSES